MLTNTTYTLLILFFDLVDILKDFLSLLAALFCMQRRKLMYIKDNPTYMYLLVKKNKSIFMKVQILNISSKFWTIFIWFKQRAYMYTLLNI